MKTNNVISMNNEALTVNAKVMGIQAIDSYAHLNYLISCTNDETVRFFNGEGGFSDEIERFVFNKATLDYIVARLTPSVRNRLHISQLKDECGETWCWALTLNKKTKFN